MKRTYLVTGGTGFLGGYLLRELVQQKDVAVIAIVRPESRKKAPQIKGVDWIEADITSPELEFGLASIDRLRNEVTDIIHLAALYDVAASHEALYLANVVGTHNVVHLAKSLPHLCNFHQISTIAVAGDFRGHYTEQDFNVGQSFPNQYAATKFASEACIHDWKTPVNRYIMRLGILVGDSQTGYIPKIDGPYYLLHALKRIFGKVPIKPPVLMLPFSERARLYMLPVDSAAHAISVVASKAPQSGQSLKKVYHVMGEPDGVSIRKVARAMLDAMEIRSKLWAIPEFPLLGRLSDLVRIPKELLHYMYSELTMATQAITKDYPEVVFPHFETYSTQAFEFAIGQPEETR